MAQGDDNLRFSKDTAAEPGTLTNILPYTFTAGLKTGGNETKTAQMVSANAAKPHCQTSRNGRSYVINVDKKKVDDVHTFSDVKMLEREIILAVTA